MTHSIPSMGTKLKENAMSYKLIISAHNECPVSLQSENILYVQTGAANTRKRFKGMIPDNTGDNISSRNLKYNELTAQYWAWKNFDTLGSPDYIGFMHYRRHFLFTEEGEFPHETWLPGINVHCFPYITERYKSLFTDACILKYINVYDCIVLLPYDLKNVGKNTVREQYASLPGQEAEFFDIFIKSAKKLAPEYQKEIERIEQGHIQYVCNMFIMKKELFFRYNEFMFPILEDVEKKIDTTGFDEKKLRFLGYLGEYLLSIFIFKLQQEGIWKIKELHGSFLYAFDVVSHPKLKYLAYWFLSKFTFGKLYKNFLHKKISYRNIYNLVNKMKNGQE